MQTLIEYLQSISLAKWQAFQAYGFFFLVVFMVLILYGYYYYLYRAEKKGERDYEKYAKLALDDSLDDSPIEEKRSA